MDSFMAVATFKPGTSMEEVFALAAPTRPGAGS